MRFIHKIFCFILIAVLILSLTGCSLGQQTIDWHMYGTWITETGEIGEKIEFSISGKVPAIRDKEYQDLELNIVWPDTFRYENRGSKPYLGYGFVTDIPRFLVTSGYHEFAFDSPMTLDFTLAPEAGLAVFNWSDRDDLFLVASTDPNADPLQLLEYAPNVN